MRAIYDEIKRVDTSLQLERKDLALLKDYYYDARYPGDNFVIVTVDELREALEIMLDVSLSTLTPCCSGAYEHDVGVSSPPFCEAKFYMGLRSYSLQGDL